MESRIQHQALTVVDLPSSIWRLLSHRKALYYHCIFMAALIFTGICYRNDYRV